MPADDPVVAGGGVSSCPHCGSALDEADTDLCPFCLGDPTRLPEGSQITALTNVNDGPPAALRTRLDDRFEDPPAE